MSDECPSFLGVLTRGCHFFKGCDTIHNATGGEPILLEREPTNPYDSNAIITCNEKGRPFSYIGREYAAEIATWMDRGVIFMTNVKLRLGCGLVLDLHPIRSEKKSETVKEERELENT